MQVARFPFVVTTFSSLNAIDLNNCSNFLINSSVFAPANPATLNGFQRYIFNDVLHPLSATTAG